MIPLSAVKQWAYVLQNNNPKRLMTLPGDLLVTDPFYEGEPLSPSAVSLLKKNGKRLVLAYLSIGEAEDYRPYWQPGWKRGNPSWLGKENPDWPGNFAVHFWEVGWQRLILGSPTASLDRILAAGFDGVYLDKADVYQDLLAQGIGLGETLLAERMTEFIKAIDQYIGSSKLLIMQNAEELLTSGLLHTALDAIAKEDLLYGVHTEGMRNKTKDVNATLGLLSHFWKPIFQVEYLVAKPVAIAKAEAFAKTHRFKLLIARRALD